MESNDPRRRNLLPVTLGSLSTLQGEDGEDGLDGVNGEQVRTSAAAHLYTCTPASLSSVVMNQAQTSLHLLQPVVYSEERYQVSHSLLSSYKPKKKKNNVR